MTPDEVPTLPQRVPRAVDDGPSVHAGDVLSGRFRLESAVGVGGMSIVWRAADQVLNRQVAVKVMTRPTGPQRVLDEARAAAGLSHPHITSVFDYGQMTTADERTVAYVVMELLEGISLGEQLRRDPLDPTTRLRICAEVASALAAAHDRGVVHRDVKPSNVMLTADGAKVIDFGIAAQSGASDSDPEGSLIGTPAYVAPERLRSDNVAPSADVYSLGVLTYVVLCGRLPWPADSPAGILSAQLTTDPEPLPALPGVPAEVGALVLRCLDRDPTSRPSAANLAAALADAHRRTGQPTAVAPVARHTPWPESGRRWAIGTAIAVTATAVAAAGVVAAITLGTDVLSGQSPPGSPAGPEPVAATTPAGRATGTAVATTGPATRTDERRGGGGTGTDPDRPTPLQPVPATGTPSASSSTSGPPTATPSPSADPTPVRPTGYVIPATGGSITVTCTDRTAEVVDINPAPGFALAENSPGPAMELRVTFRSTDHESEIWVRCGPFGVQPRVVEKSL